MFNLFFLPCGKHEIPQSFDQQYSLKPAEETLQFLYYSLLLLRRFAHGKINSLLHIHRLSLCPE